VASLNKSLSTPLQDQLDRITQNTRALVQPERLEFSERIIAELFATGIEDRILKPGSPAPAFSLKDAVTNKLVNSADLLAPGPCLSWPLSGYSGRLTPGPVAPGGACH